MKQQINWKNPLLLLTTAIIWGVAFVAQSVGMDYVEPFTFNCVRSLIGGLVLIPCIFFLNWLKMREGKERCEGGEQKEVLQDAGKKRKILLTGGVCCGILLFLASNLQQIGIQYTTVGKAGFITALYIVLVPIAGIFLKKKCGVHVWVSVLIAVIGFYLLSVKDGFTLESGDFYVLCAAILFTGHILVIDHFSPKTDGVKMACIQFFVCGLLSGVVMLFTETPDIRSILQAWKPIMYAGVMSCGVAYTLQIIGQKNYNPTIASLILSLEAVVSVLAGWIILQEALVRREIIGCVLIFCAIILAQIPWENRGKQRNKGV